MKPVISHTHMRVIFATFGLAVLLSLAACGSNPNAESTETVGAPADGVSFSQDVLPILQANCTRCHGTSRQSANLKLNTFSNIMAGSEDGPVILPGDPENSLLMQLTSDGTMPKKGEKLTDAELQTLSDWIAAGALEN